MAEWKSSQPGGKMLSGGPNWISLAHTRSWHKFHFMVC